MESWVDLPGVDIHVFDTLVSTQDYLLPLARQCPERPILCLAHHQTQGRGRGNKSWHAAPGATLCFSLCMRVDMPLHALGGVTLAFGVALCHALEQLGAKGLRLKWPNDIYGSGGKLAGILTDVYADPSGPIYLVVGVGINIDAIEPWTSVRACHVEASANEILISFVKALLAAKSLYEREGFAPFQFAYDEHDMLRGKAIAIDLEQKRMEAVVVGVSPLGELLIDKPPFRIMSGAISLINF